MGTSAPDFVYLIVLSPYLLTSVGHEAHLNFDPPTRVVLPYCLARGIINATITYLLGRRESTRLYSRARFIVYVLMSLYIFQRFVFLSSCIAFVLGIPYFSSRSQALKSSGGFRGGAAFVPPLGD